MEKGFARVWRKTGTRLTLLYLLLLLVGRMNGEAGVAPPGKPRLINCRSPEKETFTCWWEPGSSGGLPTSYTLFYRKENSDVVYECPDYITAGDNSCFFDKNHTSIWVNYNITVVAQNALGNASSDPMDVDVMNIVQPHHPENVTVTLMQGENLYLQVKWQPPRMADTRSGWITLTYELLVKREEDDEWEEYFAGLQKQYQLFSPHPGETYMVKVRCKPDHGYWSEWSATAYVDVPDYLPRERSVWMLLAVFSAFVFLIFMWVLALKKNRVKHCLLPPVPGPKIKGFDSCLLKMEKSEEIFNGLIGLGFRPPSDSGDLLVDYLEVSESIQSESRHSLSPNGKDQVKDSVADHSGGHLCDVPAILAEKCNKEMEAQGDVQTEESLETVGHLAGNDNHTPNPSAASSNQPCVQESPYHVPEESKQGLDPVTWDNDELSSYRGNAPVHGKSHFNSEYVTERWQGCLQVTKPTEYVEVQKVNQENTLILKPKAEEEMEDFLQLGLRGQDYSKVSELVNDHILLLERGSTTPNTYCGSLGSPVQQQPKQTLCQGPNGYVETFTVQSSSY
ncbi:prolactin receptor-like isoform X1 [Scleropages formosus]|uniref:Prolactin receptor n=1 Tax=Scleropages formosus TaxID=113540 RepID=A0A8C9VRM7_SCLFO|nr:prolactin receptor-like isoform X1 [Scleropages formosus]